MKKKKTGKALVISQAFDQGESKAPRAPGKVWRRLTFAGMSMEPGVG
jgi:hypothetical protein